MRVDRSTKENLQKTDIENVVFREDVRAEDIKEIERITLETGYFNDEEIKAARELVQERLIKGPFCGYNFIFAQFEQYLVGYTCYGPIPGTDQRYELYWIAVDTPYQGLGIGKKLLLLTEKRIREMGGEKIFLETSSRPLYTRTRDFYLRSGYVEEALVKDFYALGDHKIILSKSIAPRL